MVAGSWGRGGGTGGISTGLETCWGLSRAELGGPGVVAVVEVLGEGLAVLDGVGAEPAVFTGQGCAEEKKIQKERSDG